MQKIIIYVLIAICLLGAAVDVIVHGAPAMPFR
jgi:hypothetical protein